MPRERRSGSRWGTLSIRWALTSRPMTCRAFKPPNYCSYTKGMKTAVSIPDDVFQGAERLARRSRKSRSELYADAVREYIARHGSSEITETYDALVEELGQPEDAFRTKAAVRTLKGTDW